MADARRIDHKDALNRCMPAANRMKLGDMLDELARKHNTLLDAVKTGATIDDAAAAGLRIKPLAER